jgi:DNA-binding XRE family transcriptional regulator
MESGLLSHRLCLVFTRAIAVGATITKVAPLKSQPPIARVPIAAVFPNSMPAESLYNADSMTGQELKRARARLGMTQKELGEALGVHWNTVARMERDVEGCPTIRTTELAVKYLLVMKSKRREKTHGRRR